MIIPVCFPAPPTPQVRNRAKKNTRSLSSSYFTYSRTHSRATSCQQSAKVQYIKVCARNSPRSACENTAAYYITRMYSVLSKTIGALHRNPFFLRTIQCAKWRVYAEKKKKKNPECSRFCSTARNYSKLVKTIGTPTLLYRVSEKEGGDDERYVFPPFRPRLMAFFTRTGKKKPPLKISVNKEVCKCWS